MDLRPLIERKKQGHPLPAADLEAFVAAYCGGQADEAQVAGLLMAVWFAGMTPEEATALTLAMAASGEQLSFPPQAGVQVVDKHSTGGVGDKTTLVVAPLVAAAGAPVAKMSGRALGHTGGTIDKLEVIPGLRTALSPAEMQAQLARVGLVIAAQSERLVPADKLLYALRDRIGAVDSVPLIASSVMSKKIAAGAGAIALDVKAGSGAFMRTQRDALRLARLMVEIGRLAGRRMAAVITDMAKPLGRAVGDRAELVEAIETLHGRGPADLLELSYLLGERMLALAGAADDFAAARRRLTQALESGAALDKLAAMVAAQGGDPAVVRDPGLLPPPPHCIPLPAPAAGYLRRIEPRHLGAAVRRVKDAGDHTVGLHLAAALGDRVDRGQPLATLEGTDGATLDDALPTLTRAFTIGDRPPTPRPLLLGEVR